jgi:hypothetical protein
MPSVSIPARARSGQPLKNFNPTDYHALRAFQPAETDREVLFQSKLSGPTVIDLVFSIHSVLTRQTSAF